MTFDFGFAALHAMGVLVWIPVLHAFRPRLAWSIPAGTALAAAPLAPGCWNGNRWSLLHLAAGLAAGTATAGAAAWTARRARVRRRGPEPGTPLGRLWRGELPAHLGALSLFVWLLTLEWCRIALDGVPLHAFPRWIGIWVVALWVAGPVGVAFAYVGIWRSVRRDAPRAPGRPAAWLARLALLPAWLVLLAISAVIVPDRMAEFGRLAFGASERESYSLRVLRGGRELEVSGRMGFGLTDDVAAKLASSPGVRLVHLDSPGGRVVEGERLAALIRERRLGTYVAAKCASACVMALAAGEPRLLSTDARVGLHRSRARFETPLDRLRSSEQMVEALVALGVDPSFARHGAETPNESMWWPSHDEIFAARLATRHARPEEVALSGLAGDELDRLPLELRADPVFQAVFEFERPHFERWATALRAGYEQGLSLDEALAPVSADIDALFEGVMSRDLPRASDRAVRQLFDVIVDVIRRARKERPDRCAALLDGNLGGALGRTVLGDRAGPASAALAEVLASSRLEPVAPSRLDPLDPALRTAIRRVAARVPGWVEADDENPSDPCTAVDGVVALYEEVLRLPADMGAPVLRGMASAVGDRGDGEDQERAGRRKTAP